MINVKMELADNIMKMLPCLACVFVFFELNFIILDIPIALSLKMPVLNAVQTFILKKRS